MDPHQAADRGVAADVSVASFSEPAELLSPAGAGR
jgi:hypothetical protein